MRSSQRIFVACWLLLALSFAAWAGAQGKAQTPKKPAAAASAAKGEDETFIDIVNVSVVNIDAYVTDKKGNAVKGLTKDDFQLFENGRPVEITNFYAVNDGKAVNPRPAPEPPPAATAQAPAPTPPSAAEPTLDSVTPEDQKLRLVIYIDNFNLRPFNRNRVMRELRAFIGNKLSPGDQLM
ncbi:MAG: hypothetical protein ACJ75H_09875, partial [Thermoanaerobaculia bacterium]